MPQGRKETAEEFTQRLIKEEPKGLQGLAYLLVQIRKAVASGILKPEVTDTKTGAISKFANVFSNAATGHNRHVEKVSRLMQTLTQDSELTLNHLMKEQGFVNEEAIIEKNQIFMQKKLRSQEQQMESFLKKTKDSIAQM